MLTSNLFKRWTYKFFAPDFLQGGHMKHSRDCLKMTADAMSSLQISRICFSERPQLSGQELYPSIAS